MRNARTPDASVTRQLGGACAPTLVHLFGFLASHAEII
jgi:hypothetical protein